MDLVVSSWKDSLRGKWDRQCLQTKLESKLWGGTRKDTSGSGLRQNFIRGTANYPGALWICFICLPRREDILERSECNGDEMGSFGRRSATNSQPPFRDFFAQHQNKFLPCNWQRSVICTATYNRAGTFHFSIWTDHQRRSCCAERSIAWGNTNNPITTQLFFTEQ